jgi:hypothetical protein
MKHSTALVLQCSAEHQRLIVGVHKHPELLRVLDDVATLCSLLAFDHVHAYRRGLSDSEDWIATIQMALTYIKQYTPQRVH